MGAADRVASTLDRLVGIFSPAAQLRRSLGRERLAAYERMASSPDSGSGENPWGARAEMYAAAKSNRLTGGWAPANSDVNRIIAASSPMVRARVRQLIRDFPYFHRAASVSVDYVVGSGITFQSRILEPSGKAFDKQWVQATEDAFSFWMDEADFARKLHYYEIMQLGKLQDNESGEFLIVKRFDRSVPGYLPYQLQMIEADWLTDMGATPVGGSGKSYIDQGIEYDIQSGRVIAYHFTDPDGWGRVTKVLAKDVVHGFKTLRPGQLRGISPYAAGVILANDLDNYIGATVDTAKLAAKWLAIVETSDPMSRQFPNTQVPTGLQNLAPADSTKKIEYLENAIIEYLRPGEKITLSQNPNPSAAFSPFVKLMVCIYSIVTGIPYELISGDYDGLNYSVSRAKRNDFAFELRPLAARHVRQFCMSTFRPFMDTAVLAGKLPFRDYFQSPFKYLACEWQPPGMEAVDPLRESKANIDQMGAGLRSPQEIAAARGRDLEDIYKEIAAAKKLATTLGLDFTAASTALANNPAAIAPGTADNNGTSRSTARSLEDLQMQLMDLVDRLDALSMRQ